MTHWPFILAAYGITIVSTLAITLWSFTAMRRAERLVQSVQRDQ